MEFFFYEMQPQADAYSMILFCNSWIKKTYVFRPLHLLIIIIQIRLKCRIEHGFSIHDCDDLYTFLFEL